MSGEISVDNAMGTYVQLFCGICKKFDCLCHGIKSFDSLPGTLYDSEYPAPNSEPCGTLCYKHELSAAPSPIFQITRTKPPGNFLSDSKAATKNFKQKDLLENLSAFEISLLNKVRIKK